MPAGWIPPSREMVQRKQDEERLHDYTVAALRGLCSAPGAAAADSTLLGWKAIEVAKAAVQRFNDINRS